MIIFKQQPKLKMKLNKTIIKEYPPLEDLKVTPKTEEQHFKSTIYGYDNVTVKGVNADIDTNIKAENIREGTSILGVAGSYAGIDTSDATATTGDLLKDKTAYANGEKITGTIEYYDGSYVGTVGEALKITNARYLFYNNARLDILNELLNLCENVTITDSMFSTCSNLTTLDLSSFDLSKIYSCSSMFANCTSLTNFKSFKNLGKGFTRKTDNYYDINFSMCINLTHESLMDIINNLYDLNLTYNVANGGTLYRQKLNLGATNLAKLTAEEIAIATNKGWNVT